MPIWYWLTLAGVIVALLGYAYWRIARTPPPPRISPQRMRQLLRQHARRQERR